jgi:hypothetical protein
LQPPEVRHGGRKQRFEERGGTLARMTDTENDDEWTPLHDLVALHTANDADELRRRLVLFPAASGKSADAFEPWCLLHAAHKHDPEGAAATALLLLTDRRWRDAAGRLIRRIEESELVAHEDLDLLARTFLAADAHVYWEAPGDWFGGPEIVIDREAGTSNEPDGSADLADDLGDRPVVVARQVRPPLRRWAAGRVVRAEPASWAALVKRAHELDARSGAAILRGVLDGIDKLAPSARAVVVRLAAAWPQRDVREAAAALSAHREPTDTSPRAASTERSQTEPTQGQAPLF